MNKSFEAAYKVHCPYPRRLESLTICGGNYKGSIAKLRNYKAMLYSPAGVEVTTFARCSPILIQISTGANRSAERDSLEFDGNLLVYLFIYLFIYSMFIYLFISCFISSIRRLGRHRIDILYRPFLNRVGHLAWMSCRCTHRRRNLCDKLATQLVCQRYNTSSLQLQYSFWLRLQLFIFGWHDRY